MHETQHSVTLDNQTLASNPGHIKANLFRYATHYPKWPIIFALVLLGSCYLALYTHWSFYILAAFALLINWFYWKRVGEHFKHGCANPAVVVSLDPMMYAVSGNLSKGGDDYYVIKIIKKSLPKINGKAPQIGDAFPTIALYTADIDDACPHWADFDPKPVSCVTSNVHGIQRVMDSLDQNSWEQIGTWLSQVPKPLKEGLYAVIYNSEDS